MVKHLEDKKLKNISGGSTEQQLEGQDVHQITCLSAGCLLVLKKTYSPMNQGCVSISLLC